MRTIIPGSIPTSDLHQFMLGAVAPRPIAFVSTISADGVPNLAPYSFYNAFSSNPPIVIFSSNRRVENNTTKDTLANVEATGEVVINVVTHEIVRQMALTSVEYPNNVDEFEKAGFTKIPSDTVKPFRVAESPIHMECKVRQIINLGDMGGAGNLIICEITRMHIREEVLTNGRIDPQKLRLMARMGRFYYAEASGKAVTEIIQKVNDLGIGFDQLPDAIRHSKVLTGNDLAQIAALVSLPTQAQVEHAIKEDLELSALLLQKAKPVQFHKLAKKAIKGGAIQRAACILMASL